MGPLLFILLGIVALGAGALVLRSFGPRYRVGRLLAATPSVSVAEARALAGGPPRYVAVRGRIDAEDEFEDDAHRPLVLRRARIQLRRGSDWLTVDEHTTAVDFDVREGLEAIAIDHGALDAGLVVVPRESVGTAADAPERVPPGTDPDAAMRLVIEQVSSVEHAIVLGVPVAGGPVAGGPVAGGPVAGASVAGGPVAGASVAGTSVAGPSVAGELVPGRSSEPIRMTAGLGRPLILTTLEPAEAMRILAAGGPRRPLVAAMALGLGLVSLTIGVAWALLGMMTATALAASPAPSAAGGDPRSSGQGPGLVGEPMAAIALVVAIGLLAAVATIGYVRLTGGRRT